MRYEIPTELIGTYRQMTIDTTAILDPDGFDTDDQSESATVLRLIGEQAVRDTDGDDVSDEFARDCFAAIYGRQPDATDMSEGLWSHCCAAV